MTQATTAHDGVSTSAHVQVTDAVSITRREDGVAVVWLDVPGESVNTLRATFVDDFNRVLDRLEAMPDIKGAVLTSAKEDSFIAGADIKVLAAVDSSEAAEDMCRAGQEILDRIERCGIPIVAAIHGACLGGGLEVALACKQRVASDDRKTKLGLPEVQLGLLPGLGGTQRLPRLIGAQAALDLLLTGKQIDARKASKLGLVDEVVPAAIVVDVAAERAAAAAKANGAKQSSTLDALKHLFDSQELTELALADNPLGRKVLFDQARRRLLSKTRGNYPGPERILEVVKLGLERGMRAGLEAEAEAFGKLAMSPQAAELMRIFLSTQELKKDSGVETPVEPRVVTHVGVLGAGLMGAGVSYVSVHNAGVFVRLRDRDDASLARGLKHISDLLDERAKRRRISRIERDLLMAKVTGALDYSGLRNCELIIEAVFEDLELKRQVLSDVQENAPEAIFASNTSSLPISSIAMGARDPERVIGMHYFSPVHKMPLLEIVVTDQTAPWVTASCVEFGKRQGKTVIVVRDGAGFYTTRILGPYLNEAAFILGEGVAIEKIDGALLDFGFPVGPIALLDEVGIDVGHKVAEVLHEAFGDRIRSPEGMQKLIDDNRLGRKNARGFYEYGERRGKRKRPVDSSVYGVLGVTPTVDKTDSEIASRCALQMVNEAVHCLEKGILRSPRDGDIGAIFGLGFPPYLGGPFRYVDALGAAEVVRRLERHRTKHGERFAPAPLLERMAKEDEKFYRA